MVESVRVRKNCPGEYGKRVESLWLIENGRILANTEKSKNPGEYREMVESVRVPKNCPGEYRKRVESVWLIENGRIQANTEKILKSRRIAGNGRIRASTEKLSGRVPEKGWISVSENGRIRANTEKS